MGAKDAKETAQQIKQLKKRELEAERNERREAKRRHEEEELRERVEAAKMDEAEEQEQVEGENVNSNEESMKEVEVDPTFHSAWVDRQHRSDTHQQNRTPLPTVASIAVRGHGPPN